MLIEYLFDTNCEHKEFSCVCETVVSESSEKLNLTVLLSDVKKHFLS